MPVRTVGYSRRQRRSRFGLREVQNQGRDSVPVIAETFAATQTVLLENCVRRAYDSGIHLRVRRHIPSHGRELHPAAHLVRLRLADATLQQRLTAIPVYYDSLKKGRNAERQSHSNRSARNGAVLIGRGRLDMIDHQNLDRAFCWL